MIDNFLSELSWIELHVVSGHSICPIEWNGLLDVENQTRRHQANVTPELSVKDNILRGIDHTQDHHALLFDLQSFCISAITDTTLDATHQVANQRLPASAAVYSFTGRRGNDCSPKRVPDAPPIDRAPHAERHSDHDLQRLSASTEQRKPGPLLLDDVKCALCCPALDVIRHDSLPEKDVTISIGVGERNRWVDIQRP